MCGGAAQGGAQGAAEGGVQGGVQGSGQDGLVLQQPSELGRAAYEQSRRDLNEDAATTGQHLAHVQDWLRKQPHLPDHWDEQRLLTFLRGCKFSLEKTKRKLDMYFTMRAAVPEFFADRDISCQRLRNVAAVVEFPALPRLTPDALRIVVCRGLAGLSERAGGAAGELRAGDAALAFKLFLMAGDVRLAEEREGVAGDVYVLDAAAASPRHLTLVPPATIRKFLVIAQEAYPVRVKAVHVVNVSPIVDSIFQLVKPLLKDKLRNRIFFHRGVEELWRHVPRELLPSEYGGAQASCAELSAAWLAKLDAHRTWFLQQRGVAADESRRPAASARPPLDQLFGLDGSFKQLSID